MWKSRGRPGKRELMRCKAAGRAAEAQGSGDGAHVIPGVQTGVRVVRQQSMPMGGGVEVLALVSSPIYLLCRYQKIGST